MRATALEEIALIAGAACGAVYQHVGSALNSVEGWVQA